MEETIYVQIASYRDLELKPTIKDLMEKAARPDKLVIGVCWQHDDNENMDEYIGNKQFKIININWKFSTGVGLARSELQKLYNGETYTLQLDSHHRFIKNWDTELIAMLKELQADGYPKPMITTYAGVYDPNDPKIFLDNRPFTMETNGFNNLDKILLFYPEPIDNYAILKKPVKARFISGHFYFTLGQHCSECKYDPNIYFHGEEISLSVRSYTHGYDLFHPHKLVLWHNYIRNNRTKHWDDHSDVWLKRDTISKILVNDLLSGKNYEYGLGNVRSINDYEKYAGIDFNEKKIDLKWPTK